MEPITKKQVADYLKKCHNVDHPNDLFSKTFEKSKFRIINNLSEKFANCRIEHNVLLADDPESILTVYSHNYNDFDHILDIDILLANLNEMVQFRMAAFAHMKSQMDIPPSNESKKGDMKREQSVSAGSTAEYFYPTLIDDVRAYIQKHSDINPDDLFSDTSFVRETKAGIDILNKTLCHFTQYIMKAGVGLEYCDTSKKNEAKSSFETNQCFEDIRSLDDLVALCNILNLYMERDREHIKEDIKKERGQNMEEPER